MRLEIDIPKEFEEHFNSDRFEDSLRRLSADAHLIAGKYERETVTMLIKAFREALPSKENAKKVEYSHHCPNCGSGLPTRNITSEYCSCCFNWKYCPDCGQKLRWE